MLFLSSKNKKLPTLWLLLLPVSSQMSQWVRRRQASVCKALRVGVELREAAPTWRSPCCTLSTTLQKKAVSRRAGPQAVVTSQWDLTSRLMSLDCTAISLPWTKQQKKQARRSSPATMCSGVCPGIRSRVVRIVSFYTGFQVTPGLEWHVLL